MNETVEDTMINDFRTIRIFTALLAFFAVFSGPALAQSTSTVAGHVTNMKTGRPLPGANVLVEGTGDGGSSRGTSTGPQGRFAIDGLPPGRYTVRARFVGYTSQSREVSLSAGDGARAPLPLAPNRRP